VGKLLASVEAGGKRHALGTRRRRRLLAKFRAVRCEGVSLIRNPKG
jgi:hypothetical protein